MILHSDRGSQFTCTAFRKTLSKYGAVQSMSGTGRCYDNARMESFFCYVKKGKAVSAPDCEAADGAGTEHCVPLHHDLLQPAKNLYCQSGRPAARDVPSGRQMPDCLKIIFGVFRLCTVLDFSS